MPRRRTSASRVALCAVLTALAAALVSLASYLPTGSLGVVAAAGLLPAAAVVSAGLPAGCMTWAGASILAALLAPDKSNVLLFVLLFGCYPLVKCLIERLRSLPLELFCKLVFFNAMLSLFLFVLKAFLPPGFLDYATWLVYGVGSAVFLLYDYGLSKLIALYVRRVDKAVRRKPH